jgi:hypothetical protein
MLKRLFGCVLAVGLLLGASGTCLAQALPAFPVDRVRPSPEKDLITTARLTTTSFNFLKLTSNARSAGMGDAYAAVGNDLTAIYYNPAGITQVETARAVQVGYAKWIVGARIGTAAFAVKTKVAVFGVSAVFYSTEEFEETTSANPAGTGRMIKGTDTAIGVSIAKQVTDKLSVGGSVKAVTEDLDLVSYTTVDFDFGTLFYTGYRSTRLAMSLKNLGADREVVANKARVPTVFNISGAGEVYGNLGDPLSITLAAEQAYYTDFAARYYVGVEAWVNNMFALRGGWKTRHDSENWSVGAGLKQEFGGQRVNVDVSYSNAKAFGEKPIRLTVGYGF